MKTVPPDPEKLLQRMAALCARSEQCRSDIDRKLRRAGLSDTDSRKLTDRLAADRFIDDRRFAGSFARDKVRFSGWGKLKIRMALAAKRIDSDIIAEALDSIPAEDYRKALVSAATIKARTLDLADYSDRGRLLRHLATRGFEPSACTAVCRLSYEKIIDSRTQKNFFRSQILGCFCILIWILGVMDVIL